MYPLSRKSTIICTYVKCLIETAWRYLSEKMNSTSIHKMIFDSITHYITWKLVWCNSHENNLTGAPMEWHFLILMMLFNRWMFYKMYIPITWYIICTYYIYAPKKLKSKYLIRKLQIFIHTLNSIKLVWRKHQSWFSYNFQLSPHFCYHLILNDIFMT